MTDEEIEIYRCSECGKLSVSLGWLHAHIEKHRGYTRFGIQLPIGRTSPGRADELMEMTDVISVDEYTVLEEPEAVTS